MKKQQRNLTAEPCSSMHHKTDARVQAQELTSHIRVTTFLTNAIKPSKYATTTRPTSGGEFNFELKSSSAD